MDDKEKMVLTVRVMVRGEQKRQAEREVVSAKALASEAAHQFYEAAKAHSREVHGVYAGGVVREVATGRLFVVRTVDCSFYDPCSQFPPQVRIDMRKDTAAVACWLLPHQYAAVQPERHAHLSPIDSGDYRAVTNVLIHRCLGRTPVESFERVAVGRDSGVTLEPLRDGWWWGVLAENVHDLQPGK